MRFIGVRNQGPPDLEEWFKKLFSKVGLKKRTSVKDLQPSENKGISGWWGIIVFVAIVSVLLTGIITVKPGEEVVVTRLGVYHNTLTDGTHWTIPVIDHHTVVNVTDNMPVAISALMLTQDQYMVKANVVLNYKVIDPKTYLFSSASVDSILQAYLQAASLEAVESEPIVDLLNKDNYATLATQIQNNLNLVAKDYGIQLEGVSINSVTVPDALSGQFMQAINQAQNQVKAMMQSAQNYKDAMAPLAAARALQLQQTASFKRAAIIVAAQANAAEFKALLPSYQKDPRATAAYLPLAVMPNSNNQVSNAATPSLTPGSSNRSGAQNAYARWNSANQSQANAQN